MCVEPGGRIHKLLFLFFHAEISFKIRDVAERDCSDLLDVRSVLLPKFRLKTRLLFLKQANSNKRYIYG